MSNNDDLIDDWNEIPIKQKKQKKQNKQIKEFNKDLIKLNDLSYLIDIVKNIISKYNPKYAYIFGSRARKTNKIDSDLDLILCYQNKPTIDINEYTQIKNQLISTLNIHVDLIILYIANKSKKHSELDLCFYDNISVESINVIGEMKFSNICDNIVFKVKI